MVDDKTIVTVDVGLLQAAFDAWNDAWIESPGQFNANFDLSADSNQATATYFMHLLIEAGAE